MQKFLVPYLGHEVTLVDREQLRFTLHGRTMSAPLHLAGIDAITAPPAVFDWTKNRSIVLPILGNDTKGDCFYAWACHMVQLWTGNASKELSFNAQAVINRYLKIAGGDNGLDDATIFAEFQGGIIGPSGPNKILDEMTVNPSDAASIAIGLYYFTGGGFTLSLPEAWLNSAAPGVIWDVVNSPIAGGHATAFSGKNAAGNYICETWGISPGIQVTPRGMLSVQPEIIICFSAEMFNAATGLSPSGQTWEQARALWLSLGGKDVGSSPFAPTPAPVPQPPVPPTPPTPSPIPTPVVVLGTGKMASGQAFDIVPAGSEVYPPGTGAAVADAVAGVKKLEKLFPS